MKKIDSELNDWLRPEYKRSDFGKFVRGKYANRPIEYRDVVTMLLACVGEDEGILFQSHSRRNPRKPGDWTYEIARANQIILRYWPDSSHSIEEPLGNHGPVTTPNERQELLAVVRKGLTSLRGKIARQ